ncbi:YbhB/YbcL family Raf kinase inhibitor-like protein [Tenacibaculum sp. MAR_2009_124]|uniref:YbhB/YbcL family Raf kinase inhibitor-like protein n=1 Tax=Tenacibaculum sp. MAR_2009_124 TaxID=1250059 RepID=UPI000B81769F|nr:YbhB/YbcL family Raf kinase inhibitor-like protein [Tenacibaculum sp. MAR_2009_124]
MKQLTLILLLATASLVGQNTFTLTSSDLGGQVTKNQEFSGFGCSGNNESPQLSWKNAPMETKSFAITMYDPDAPTGSGWWHWLVFDIPTSINSIPNNAGNINLNLLPKEVIQSITDYGTQGYGGPCPPEGHGFHQYIITVYALNKETLKLNAKTNPAVVGYYLNSSTLAKASIVAYYKRDK